jgi:hypothetical protein
MRGSSTAQAKSPARPAATTTANGPAITAPTNTPPADVTVERKQEELVRWDVLGRSYENRVIEYAQFGSGQHRVLVIGSLRGNEPEGVALAQALAEHLVRFPQRLGDLTVTIVRDPNPDGRIRRTSGNARGVDLDRNFISSGWRSASDNSSTGLQPESEPETRVLADLMVDVRPDRVILLGTAQQRASVVYCGPAEYLGAQVAIELNGQASRAEPNATAGSLVTMAGVDRSIPTLLIGVPPQASADGVWSANKRGLMTAVGCGTPIEFVSVGPKPNPRAAATQAAPPSAATNPPAERRSSIVSTAESRPANVAPQAPSQPPNAGLRNNAHLRFSNLPPEEPQPLYYNQLRFGRPAVDVVSPRSQRAQQGMPELEQPTPAPSVAPVGQSGPSTSFEPPFDPRIQRLPPAQLFSTPRRSSAAPAGMPQPPIPYPRTGY